MKINQNGSKFIEIKPENARTLSVLHNYETVNELVKDDKILKINFNDLITFDVNSSVKYPLKDKIYTFDVEYIRKVNNKQYELKTNSINKSTLFLFPLITEKDIYSHMYFYNKYLENCYLYDSNFPGLSDNKHLFVSYRFFETELYKEVEKLLTKSKYYLRTYEPNAQFSIYIFEIPEVYHKDVELFIKGKYSEFSENAKQKIISFGQYKQTDILYQVLYKAEDLRKSMEKTLGCKISKKSELMNYPNLIKEEYKNKDTGSHIIDLKTF